MCQKDFVFQFLCKVANCLMKYSNDLQGNLCDLQETCRAISEENEKKQSEIEDINKELAEEKKKAKELAEQQAESENILRLMQERVDNVNQEHAEVNALRDQIREYKEKVNDIPLMQQVVSVKNCFLHSLKTFLAYRVHKNSEFCQQFCIG